MRQALAILLLLVFGASLPFSAEPLRYCLLEKRIVLNLVTDDAALAKCCDGCEIEVGADTHAHEDAPTADHERGSCCLGVKQLPDSSLPTGPDKVPAFYALEHSWDDWAVLAPTAESPTPWIRLPHEVRPPPPPAMRRAILGIWTI